MNHRAAVLCVVALVQCWIFHANAEAHVSIVPKFDSGQSVTFNVKHSLHLSCNITSDAQFTVKWLKDGKDVKDVLGKRWEAKNKDSMYTLEVKQTTEDDAGTYSCVATIPNDTETSKNIYVASRVYIKLQSFMTVVEEEKFQLSCVAHGKPLPHTMQWFYANDTTPASERQELMDDDKYHITQSNGTLKLVIDKVDMSDQGNYSCVAFYDLLEKDFDEHCIVKIKDKYAALWPFLGICAEVFALCAIIFIYEKKRNKTELEESDTDQSPDQKNTPDHGKESSLRHRQ